MSPSIELGSIADIAAATAAVAGLVLSARALKVAQSANATADKAHKESAKSARIAAKREDERDRRSLASHLQAWWGAIPDDSMDPDGKATYGVLVSNRGSTSSVFHNVTIKTSGNNHPKTQDLSFATVPPGLYFVESNSSTASSALSFPILVRDEAAFMPLARARNHVVHSIEFDDQLGTRWFWEPERGLSPSTSLTSGTHE